MRSEWGRGAGRQPCSGAAAAPVPLDSLLRPSHHALRASGAPSEAHACIKAAACRRTVLVCCRVPPSRAVNSHLRPARRAGRLLFLHIRLTSPVRLCRTRPQWPGTAVLCCGRRRGHQVRPTIVLWPLVCCSGRQQTSGSHMLLVVLQGPGLFFLLQLHQQAIQRAGRGAI